MSKGDNWVPIDKMLAQDLKHISRPFSRIEAMFSYTVDVDNNREGSVLGYSTQWSWSRNKTRRFLNCIRTVTGHKQDSKRTQAGHPIHFIDNVLWDKKDTSRTVKGHKQDTSRPSSNDPNPDPKEIPPISPKGDESLYSETFLRFWGAYPKKEGKGAAYKAYLKIKNPKPTLGTILKAIESHKKTSKWQSEEFITMPATWLNQRRWEDEPTPLNGKTAYAPILTPEQQIAEFLS